MAIVVGNISSGKEDAAVTSLVYAHDNNPTDDGVLVVTVSYTNNSLPSAVTYAGVAMTLAANKSPGSGNGQAVVYYLAGAATGSNNVSITVPSTFIASGAVTLSGADTTPGATSETDLGSSGGTASITTEEDNSVIIDAFTSQGTSGVASPGGSQTLIHQLIPLIFAQGSSYREVTTAGSYDMSWSVTSGGDSASAIVEFKEAGGGGAATDKFFFLF